MRISRTTTQSSMPHNRPLLGIALTVLSSALLAIKDGFAKSFLDEVAPLQMIWV
jgi:hypothetical protein